MIILRYHLGVRGFSSVVRALPCQGRGRELESLNPHQTRFFRFWKTLFLSAGIDNFFDSE